MLHPGRCGSTVVAEMLAEHPAIHWAGEIFEPLANTPGAGEPKWVEQTIEQSCYSTRARTYGFETKYLPQLHLSAQCINMTLPQYLELLRGLRFTKYIVLERRNYLRRAISGVVGRASSVWHARDVPSEPTRVHVDVDAFRTWNETEPLVRLFERMDESSRLLRDELRGDDSLFLVYERDIMNDPFDAYRKICDFLGVQPRSPRPAFQRTNPFPIESMISNLDEVTAALDGTPYAWMLSD
jgi:LPS sulfotransferase NodH